MELGSVAGTSPNGRPYGSRRLRGAPQTASLPVIMLTGRAHPEDVREGLRAGASEFLVKPFREAELLAAIQRVSRSRLP
jgi:DNA-binding response OmpR family regulator